MIMSFSLKNLLFGAVAPGHSSRPRTGFLRSHALLFFAATLVLFTGAAQAQWLTGYQYRKSLPINAGVSAGTDYQIQVRVGESSGATGYDLHVEGHALNFPNDVRFTDSDGTTNLGHWLESITGTTPNRTATYWVKVNANLNSTQSILAYYSKSADTSASNGDNTFSFFDDFPGAAIDTSKWIIDNASGWSVTGGELRGQNNNGRIRSVAPFSSGVILETKYRSVTQAAGGNMALGFYTSASTNFGWLNQAGADYYRSNSSWVNIGNVCNLPVIARITAKSTTVDFYVYRQDTGAVWQNKPNITNTVSNEQIALGTRYDNGWTGYTYDAYWDWVRVRKYATTTPTLAAAGTEQIAAPIVTITAPVNGSQVVSGTSPSATATVSAGVPPYTVKFYTTYNSGGAVLAGTVSASPYTINLGPLVDGNYTIYAQVTDSLLVTTTSATNTFTVAPDNTPPSPNSMTFAVNPVSISENSIRMTATTATDFASSPVQYYFENITNNAHDSGWISTPTWTDSDLILGTSYSYRVKARDSATPPNVTGFSAVSSATPAALTGRSVTLVNPGFENPILNDGGVSGAYIMGWSATRSMIVFDIFNPSTAFYTSGVPEGQNVGELFHVPAYSGCSQILQGAEGQFQADTTYDLKVKVGRNLLESYDGYIIQMVVNGIVITQDDNSRTPTAGSFVTASLKYLYNATLHANLVGFPIEIRLLSKGLAGGLGVVHFDDVQFTYTTSNPVANHGGPYRLSQGVPLSLNGSASLPSPGANITTYEWDLDSRNDNLGFIANLTGPTHSSIPYATLTSTYGMVLGANTIRLRVTDNTGQSTIATTTVTLCPLYTFIGPAPARYNTETWSLTTSWNSAIIPSGPVDVLIPASNAVQCTTATTPIFTGNLTIGSNSSLSLGAGAGPLQVYNAMGTPGQTVITMNSGSSMGFGNSNTPLVPGIKLNGNASITLGASTGTGAQASFNYPITGSYRMTFYGNGQVNCVANLNAPNTFNEIYSVGAPYVDFGVTIAGNAPGSLGTGNLTFDALSGGGNSALLVINAENSMADNATLSMNGNNAIKITMNANDTIARLVINSAQLPAGTYGSSTSSATFKQTWITGNAVLTVTDGQANYWDINGATAGAGGASPTGNWDSTSTSAVWNSSPAGTAATASWVSGGIANFAAGSDATGPYTVTVGGSNAITTTNSFTASSNTKASSFNVTKTGWTLNGGNCVAVLVSAINATGFTATYAGQSMTVCGAYASGNSYTGIAYIISDSLPATGDVIINVPRVYVSGDMGTVYSILSLSNVASVGTPVSKVPSPVTSTTSLTYSTSTNNSLVLGVASDSDWHIVLKSVTGICSQVITTAKPAYFNTIHCYGTVNAAGNWTDVYNASPTVLITLPFNAKSAINPLLTNAGQKISGMEFEEGSVTISGGKLELQTNSFITSASGTAGTIASQITGLSTSGITKKGLGTVVLSNATNNYTGTTTVLNGILRLGATNALPSTAVTLSGYAPGITATLDLNGYNNTLPALNFGGASSTSGSAITTGAGTLTLSGNIDFTSDNNPLGATLSGNLALVSTNHTFNIDDSSSAANDLTVSAAVSGTGGISKVGFGTLLLSGSNAYKGATTVSSGLLILSGTNNYAATGGITVNNNGAIRFDSANSINGTGKNVMIESGGLAYFGPSFIDDIQTVLNTRINSASTGVVAVDNFSSANFNFSGLDVYLGALNDVTYSGTLSPKTGEYRIGGGSGTITLSGSNALTGSRSLLVGGSVVITNTNNLSGATTISPSGRLQIGTGGTLSLSAITNNGNLIFNHSNTITQGTDFQSPISGIGVVEQSGSGTLVLNAENTYSGGTNLVAGTLKLGHAKAIGTGRLTIYSGTLDTISELTLISNNAIALGGNFSFGGTANLNMGTGNVSTFGNPVITLIGSNKVLTFGGVTTNISGGDQIITVNGTGNTLVLGGLNFSNDTYSSLVALTIGGTGNVSITDTLNDWSFFDDIYDIRLGTLTKTGTGTLTLSGNNNYTGNTVVAGGVLHLASGTQASPIYVNSGGTLGFTLGTTFNEKTITSTEKLTLNDGHKIRIDGTPPTLNYYTLMIADSIVGGAPTLETAIDGYFLEIAGNELRLTKSDITPPILLDIVNDKGAGPIVGPILPGTLVTYTLTFNEDINNETVTSADFENAGTSPITIGNIMEISPGIFTVQVTPTAVDPPGARTLQLRISSTADIRDTANNMLVAPIADDTIIDVAPPSTNWLVSSDIVDDKAGAPVTKDTLITYTLYFSQDINSTTVTSADFVNAATNPSNITIGTITEISPGVFTVQVTPTTLGNLQLSIPTTADIRNPANAMLDVDPAIVDDTTITVADPYSLWAGSETFGSDANGDGIPNGLAWLLGATDVNQDAMALLPKSEVVSGDLYLYFTTLNTTARGTASIKVQYSKDLGILDLWANHQAEVPGSAGISTDTDTGIRFDIRTASGNLIDVEARIPASAAATGKKLFSRVKGVSPLP